MHEAEGLALGVGERVGVVEPGGDARADVRGVVERHVELGLDEALHDPAEVGPADVLHRDVVAAVDLAQLVDLDDVRMGEPGRQPSLVKEHPDERLVLGELRQDALDDQVLREARGAALPGLVDLGHPARGDMGLEFVLAEGIHGFRRAVRVLRILGQAA